MTRNECIDGIQRIIDEDRNKILVRVHVGYLIHAVKYLKEQEDTINELQNAYGYLQKQFFEVQDKLLKEQEAVPVIQREIAHLLFWCCGSCGVAITDGDKFCRNCGRRMKWK